MTTVFNRPKLTTPMLRAIAAACAAGLAGEEGEGDLADVPFKDLQRALHWANAELRRREATKRRRGTP